MTAASTTSAKFDAGLCREALSLQFEPGAVVEVRIPKTNRGVVSGYYDDFERLVRDVARMSGDVPGVYITMNQVDPRLLARSRNRLTQRPENTTSDKDILSIRCLPLDFDPQRPSGISSTDGEHEAALCRAREVRKFLRGEGLPDPVYADSGNGAHLLYLLSSLPNNKDTRQLIDGCLKALAFKFDDDAVKLDESVGNPARIWKLYGTLACKGDSTPNMPHRLARILTNPSGEQQPVSVSQLQELASRLPEAPTSASHSSSNGSVNGVDLEAWIAQHGVQVASSGQWQGGMKYILQACAWDPSHTDRSAFIARLAGGGIIAGCQHNSCAGKKWPDLRDVVEPGWRDQDKPGARTLQLKAAAKIKARRVTWIWDDRVPCGEIALTPGVGGIGKSTFHAWFIAHVTRGTLPGVYFGQPKSAIICASEDSWERTIVPRLMAARADLEKVYRVEVVEAEESVNLKLPADIEDLATQIKDRDVAVVSLDPVMSLISGSIDTHKDAEVRRALEPLSRLADDTGCSILGNAHFNKAAGADPMMRLTGSAAFGQVVRAVLAFARDEDNDICVITQAKNNLGRLDLPSLSYSIESVDVDTEDGPTSVGILTMGEESKRSVQDILGDQGRNEDRSAQGEAEKFLRKVLKNGPKPAKKCQVEAEEADITAKTLRSARERICEIGKGGFEGGWVWSLKPEGAPQTPKMPLSQDRASSASSGASSADATEPSGIPASGLLSRDTPPDTCPACRQARWWTDRLCGRRVCRVCHPPTTPEAEA